MKHDIIRARLIEYMIHSNNFTKLRSYIPQDYPNGEAYSEALEHGHLRWNFLLAGKDIVCYYGRE